MSNNKYTLRGFYRPHPRTSFTTTGPSMTKQSHKQECDITFILKQYQRTGIITHVQAARPTYTDLPDHQDFQQSLEILRQADEAFALLPSTVRRHFDNDPQQFLAAFQDPSQETYLREFGLLRTSEAVPDALTPSPLTPPPAST